MHIIIAQTSGFCPGVNSAIEKTIEISKKTNKKIYTLGQLIHNNDVIRELEKRGIKAINDLSEITDPKNSVLVIRAHGIPPQLEAKIKKTGIEYIDATCPLVKRVHNIITKYKNQGYQTIILGDATHAEVIGLRGYDPNSIVISNLEDAEKLPEFEKVNFVSQTTQEEELFLQASNILAKKTKELIVSNTICEPTKNRQRETKHFSINSDIVVVVGGKHSANTKRLYEICKKLNTNTILIENDLELRPEMFKNAKTVFITAGASTPKWVVEQVATVIRKITASKDPLSTISEFIVSTGISIFITHLSVLMMSCQILNVKLEITKFFSIASAITFANLINRFSQKETFYTRKNLTTSSKKTRISLFILLTISIFFSINNLILMLGLLAFVTTSFIFKKLVEKGSIKFSKKIVIAIAWIYIFVFLPSVTHEPIVIKLLYSFIFVLSLSLIRSNIFELMYIYTDIIDEKVKKVLNSINYNYVFYLTLLLVSIKNLSNTQIFMISLSVLYYIILSKKILSKKISHTPKNEILIELPFLFLLGYFILN